MVKQEIVEELIELQRKIDRDRRQYELDAWMSLNLGIGQLKTLFFISNRGATTTGKLATALKVTPTNVTGIIDRLLEKGLITRTGDPTTGGCWYYARHQKVMSWWRNCGRNDGNG